MAQLSMSSYSSTFYSSDSRLEDSSSDAPVPSSPQVVFVMVPTTVMKPTTVTMTKTVAHTMTSVMFLFMPETPTTGLGVGTSVLSSPVPSSHTPYGSFTPLTRPSSSTQLYTSTTQITSISTSTGAFAPPTNPMAAAKSYVTPG
jgi:hypothetical protein